MDALMSTSNTVPLNLAEKVGEGIYTCSDNGVQIKGSGGHLMEPEEYGLLAEDPMKFFANVLIPANLKFSGTRAWKKGGDHQTGLRRQSGIYQI